MTQGYIVHVTITGQKEEFDTYMKNEFKDIVDADIQSWGIEGVLFISNPRTPPTPAIYESLLSKYPSLFVKVLWTSAEGPSGILLGKKDTGVRMFEWTDLSTEEEALSFRSH